jgi:hypothetical protein
VQPKLRMVANATDEVNAIRSEHAAAVKVPPNVARRVKVLRDDHAVPVERSKLEKRVVTKKLRARPNAQVSAFVRLTRDPEQWPGGADIKGVKAWKGNLLTTELSVEETLELSEEPWVTSVELGQPLAMPDQIVSAARPGAPRASDRRVAHGSVHRSGADCNLCARARTTAGHGSSSLHCRRGRFEPVVAPEELVADRDGRDAAHAALVCLARRLP